MHFLQKYLLFSQEWFFFGMLSSLRFLERAFLSDQPFLAGDTPEFSRALPHACGLVTVVMRVELVLVVAHGVELVLMCGWTVIFGMVTVLPIAAIVRQAAAPTSSREPKSLCRLNAGSVQPSRMPPMT